MPKIFWIKNRLHEQQQRLALQQNGLNNIKNNSGDSQFGDTSCEPLSLIVKKDGKKSFFYYVHSLKLLKF